MRVLICVASRHRATEEIARRMAELLEAELAYDVDEVTVHLRAADDDPAPEGYDAVVIGSAVYLGRWLREARRYVARHATGLRERPVWLFSSGPVGDPPQRVEEPHDVPHMMEATAARSHHLFAGSIDPDVLGPMERATVKVIGTAPGDYRDWVAIDVYATRLAHEMIAARSPEVQAPERPRRSATT